MTRSRPLATPVLQLLLLPTAALTVWALAATATDGPASGMRYAAFLPLTLVSVYRLPWTVFALLACGWILGVLGLSAALAGSVGWLIGGPAALLALGSAAGFVRWGRRGDP